MRKSLLTLIVVGTLASGATPGFAVENTQQQRVEHCAAMPNETSGVTARGMLFSSYLSNPSSEATFPTCTAGSAKDVALARNRCER